MLHFIPRDEEILWGGGRRADGGDLKYTHTVVSIDVQTQLAATKHRRKGQILYGSRKKERGEREGNALLFHFSLSGHIALFLRKKKKPLADTDDNSSPSLKRRL